MALDNRLVVYNEQGEPVDYDILASDVKFLPDGKDLPTKLAELEDEIGQGGYAPPEGGIPKTDLSQSVQNSLDKADSALQDEDVAEVAKTGDYNDLENKPTIPDTSGLATKTELNAKQDKISAGNGIVIAQDGKIVSVDAEVVQPVTADGTFAIRIGNNTYSINLNHEHEGMVKLEKYTEATMPQAKDDDIIYVQVDNATTPTEIEALYIFGLEFTGGGVAPGTPRLVSPSQSQISNGINIGNTTSGVATYSLKIKAKDLTQSLLVELGSGSTGYSFNTSSLPTGVTYDSVTGKLTITKEAACEINGVNIPVVYTGNDTDEDAEGTIGISSSSLDGINVEVTLVVNKATYEDLAGVKLTGSQWLQTDYYPNPNTEFVLDFKLTENVNSASDNGVSQLMRIGYTSEDNYRFAFYHGGGVNRFHFFSITAKGQSPAPADISMNDKQSDMLADHATLTFVKGQSGATLTFKGGSTERSVNAPAVGATAQTPMNIGYYPTNQIIYYCFDLTIYGLTITENGVTVRHWVPKKKNNSVPGLYDTVTGSFISSETSTPLVAVELT